MIGFHIKLLGTSTAGTPNIIDFTEYHVLGIDYEKKFVKAGERGEHGGYRSPTLTERTLALSFYPVSCDDYDLFVNDLMDLMAKRYVYFNKGDHFTSLTTSSTFVRIVATGSSIEHTYSDGTKSIDIEVSIYE